MSKKYDKFLRNEQWLRQKYWIEGFSIRKIAEEIGCCEDSVRAAFKCFNIPRRTISESLKGEKHPLYGKHRSEKTKRKISKTLEGHPSPNKGKHPTEETRQKQRDAHKGKHPSGETRVKQGLARKGTHRSEATKAKMREAHKGKHPNEVTRQKLRDARENQKMPTRHTKIERILKEIVEKYTDKIKYTGDGSFWVKTPEMNINPDFIVTGKKIAIEANGEWWHSRLHNYKLGKGRDPNERRKLLKKVGWKLIVFWGEDLLRKDAEDFVLSELKKHKVF